MSCLRAASDVMAPKLTLRFDMTEGVKINRPRTLKEDEDEVELSHGRFLSTLAHLHIT